MPQVRVNLTRTIACFAALSGVSLGLAACGNSSTGSASGSSGDTVSLNFESVTTGKYAVFGLDENAGARIAMEDINAAGGIDGHKLKINFQDTQSDPTQAVSLARANCSNHAIVQLGPITSAEDESVVPVTNSMSCPTILPTAAAADLAPDHRPWVFQLSAPADVQAPLGIKKFVAAVHPKKAVVIKDTTDPSAGGQADSSFTSLKAEHVTSQLVSVTEQTNDLAPIVTRIAGQKPDAIVISATDVLAASLIRQLGKQGLGDIPTLLTAAGASSATLGLPTALLQNHYYYTAFWPQNPDPKIQHFVSRFKTIRKAIPTQLATETYDMFMMVKAAYTKCKALDTSDVTKTRVCIRDYFQSITSFPGLTGTFNMQKVGYATTDVFLMGMRNGAFTRIS